MFSIIVPIYKPYHNYVVDCLKSIQNQKYDDYEVLLIYDEEVDEINNFTADKRFKKIKCDNPGVSFKRNIGIKNAKNKYLIFIDCDDCLQNDFLIDFALMIKNSSAELWCFNFKTFSSGEGVEKSNQNNFDHFQETSFNLLKDKFEHDNLAYKYGIYLGTVWGKVFLKKIIDSNNILFDESLKNYEDSFFVFRYLECITNVVVYPKYYSYCYRKNESGLASTVTYNNLTNLIYYSSLLYHKQLNKMDISYFSNWITSFLNNYYINKIKILKTFGNLKRFIKYSIKDFDFKKIKAKNEFMTTKNKFIRFLLQKKQYFLYFLLIKKYR